MQDLNELSDAEVRVRSNKIREKIANIKQKDGESYINFLERMAKSLGWGQGDDAIVAGKL